MIKAIGLISITFISLQLVGQSDYYISPAEVESIGRRVWNNESNRNMQKMVLWNPHEECLSLGIAHFTWYPKHDKRDRPGMFPQLIKFLDQQGYTFTPEPNTTIDYDNFYAPWHTREEFIKDIDGHYITKLKEYLSNSTVLQMHFIVTRAQEALPKIMKLATTSKQLQHVKFQYDRLMATPSGRYILVDYINFRGEGGLFKVLIGMQGIELTSLVDEFCAVAKEVLTQQAQNSPEGKQMRWLQGWLNRLSTYTLL